MSEEPNILVKDIKLSPKDIVIMGKKEDTLKFSYNGRFNLRFNIYIYIYILYFFEH